MRASLLLGCVVLTALALPAAAQSTGMPDALVRALTHLSTQRSYSWETINTDPGPVQQQIQTRKGTYSTIQQSQSPHIKGVIDRNGDTYLERDWDDGMRLDVFIAKEGGVAVQTPLGWLNEREVVLIQNQDAVRGGSDAQRLLWLRRAERSTIRRPDQELVPLIKARTVVEKTGTDTYVLRTRVTQDPDAEPEDKSPAIDITLTIRLRTGVVSDYDVAIEGTQAVSGGRARVSINDYRTVVLNLTPVSRVPASAEARAKAAADKK